MQTSELVLNPQLALEAVSAQHLKLRWAAYINHRAQHTAVPRTQISSPPLWESHFPSKISLALNVVPTIDQCHTSQKGSTVLYFAAMHSLDKPQTEKTQHCTTAGNWSYLKKKSQFSQDPGLNIWEVWGEQTKIISNRHLPYLTLKIRFIQILNWSISYRN